MEQEGGGSPSYAQYEITTLDQIEEHLRMLEWS